MSVIADAKMYEQLVADQSPLSKPLAELDSSNPAVRVGLLNVANRLVERFIVPVEWLLSTDQSGRRRIDLDEIAGQEVSQLLLDSLAVEMSRLEDDIASDADWDRALRGIGIEIDDSRKRYDFFHAWMATRALRLIGDIVYKLRDGGLTAEERATLNRIASTSLPSVDRSILKGDT